MKQRFSNPSTIQAAVILVMTLFVYAVTKEQMATFPQACTAAVTLVGGLYLAMSNGTPPDEPPPANPVTGAA